MGPYGEESKIPDRLDPSDQITGKFNGSSVPGVTTLTPVTPLTHLYPPDPPYRPKHAPKRNPMANPDPTESSHTPRGSIAPMGHQGGALGHGYGDLHCCEHPFGLHRHVVPRAAFSDHMREHGRFHPNPSIRSRLRHP